MIIENFFLLISASCLICATLVIGIANPIHSILLLILVFFFGSILLLLLNVEFFAFVFLIVYVGAIAVLFLFMVMTLDIKVVNVTQRMKDFISHRGWLLLILIINLMIFLDEDYFFLNQDTNEISYLLEHADYAKYLKTESHLEVIGKILFTEYKLAFLFCGFILFIAMIGAIVLTIEDSKLKTIKQQDAVVQTLRKNEHAIFNFKNYKKTI